MKQDIKDTLIFLTFIIILFFNIIMLMAYFQLINNDSPKNDNYRTEYSVFVPTVQKYNYILYVHIKTYDPIDHIWIPLSKAPTISIEIDNNSTSAAIVDNIAYECNKASNYLDSDKCRNELLNMYKAIK